MALCSQCQHISQDFKRFTCMDACTNEATNLNAHVVDDHCHLGVVKKATTFSFGIGADNILECSALSVHSTIARRAVVVQQVWEGDTVEMA
eukprot:385330-Ditylum_brightwellii.AAC.1